VGASVPLRGAAAALAEPSLIRCRGASLALPPPTLARELVSRHGASRKG
jgi:hypothetical protein